MEQKRISATHRFAKSLPQAESNHHHGGEKVKLAHGGRLDKRDTIANASLDNRQTHPTAYGIDRGDDDESVDNQGPNRNAPDFP